MTHAMYWKNSAFHNFEGVGGQGPIYENSNFFLNDPFPNEEEEDEEESKYFQDIWHIYFEFKGFIMNWAFCFCFPIWFYSFYCCTPIDQFVTTSMYAFKYLDLYGGLMYIL